MLTHRSETLTVFQKSIIYFNLFQFSRIFHIPPSTTMKQELQKLVQYLGTELRNKIKQNNINEQLR